MARLLSIVLISALFALPLAARSGAPADEYSDFLQKFDQYAKLGANKKLDDLMRDKQGVAIHWIQRTAEQISVAPNDVLYERYDALRGSWKRVYETDFPDKMEEFFAYSDINTKRERSKLKVAYDKAARSQSKAQEEKDAAKLILVADKFEQIANSFQQLNDKWMESQSRLTLAVALEERWHKGRTNFDRMTNAYARFVKLREDLGVRDRWYKETVPRLKTLTAEGFGNEGAAEGEAAADLVPIGPELAGPAMKVQLEYEPLDVPKDVLRPNYYLDMHWQIWPTVALGSVGSTAKFTRVEDSPTVIRESASKIVIDTDGDGKGDVDWPTRGKLEAVTFEIGAGATKRTWSVLSEIGRQQDFYQGVPMNLLPTDSSFNVYIAPAGSLVGDVGGVKVQVIDDNLDGVYGSAPSSWKHMGVAGDRDTIELDSIRIGSNKRAQPWSQYVNLGKAGWHSLESTNGGTTVTAQAVSFKTGSIQIKAKGLKPDFFVIQGLGQDLAETYIDVAGGKKVEVPIGAKAKIAERKSTPKNNHNSKQKRIAG